ncbi:hypothetical protein SteCoe_2120 [Stentor coeruleus]|uniref:ubiquitinyl hydrolase 1 n=1 Tax=Stentor coeruleus TaxID=5963 RepID=A0A1R2D082_9CILI|nr:hypothetical protein SteCoe_2120 [Stentor coeruleus]
MNEFRLLQDYIDNNELIEAEEFIAKEKKRGNYFQKLFEAKLFLAKNKISEAEANLTDHPKLISSDIRDAYTAIQHIIKIEVKMLQNKKKEVERDVQDLENLFKNNALVREFINRIRRKSLEIQEKTKSITFPRDEATEKEVFLKLYRENSDIKDQSRWYVVDLNWFLKWKSKVGLKKNRIYADLPFNNLWEEFTEETLPNLDNSQIIDNSVPEDFDISEDSPSFYSLKAGLSENNDYVLIPEAAYKLLKENYNPCQNILRKAIKVSEDSCIIEVYLKKIIIGYNSSSGVQIKIHKTSRKTLLSSIAILVLKILKIIVKSNSDSISKIKFWKIDTDITSEEKLAKLINTISNDLFIDGSKPLSNNLCVDEAEISEKNILYADNGISGHFQLIENTIRSSCSICSSSRHNALSANCKICKISTCSESCLTKHKKSNSKCADKKRRFILFSCFCRGSGDMSENETPRQSSKKIKNSVIEITPEAKSNSLVSSATSSTSTTLSGSYSIVTTGLQNLGNTCFMNSAIQCLAHCEDLTRFFLCDDYAKKINRNNPLGTKGKLAVAYAEILKVMKSGREKSIAPWSLKKTIASVASQFEGYQQHDSHEFLSYLISGLHEDLNQIHKKPYDGSDIKFTNDQEVADESWRRHHLRNKSVIVDLMYGQYKSTLKCPKCLKISYAFDPYNCLSLPIPQSSQKKTDVSYIPYMYDEDLVSISCFYDQNNTIADLKAQVANKINKNQSELRIMDCKFKVPLTLVDENLKAEMARQSYFYFYQIPEDAEVFFVVTVIFENYSTELHPRLVAVDRDDDYARVLDKIEKHLLPLFKHVLPEGIENFENMYKVYTHSTYKISCFICGQPRCNMSCRMKPSSEKLYKHLAKTNFIYVRVEICRPKQRIDLSRYTKFKTLKSSQTSKNALTIQECFRAFSTPEILDKHNSWYCPNCKTHVQASKHLEIFRVPQVLIIHLKRFRIHSYTREKINIPIDYPKENLDISEFVIGDKPPLYDLFAVSNHFGTLSGGHYTATVYNSQKARWFECNDSQVTETRDFSETASYVLFYKAKNSIKI